MSRTKGALQTKINWLIKIMLVSGLILVGLYSSWWLSFFILANILFALSMNLLMKEELYAK